VTQKENNIFPILKRQLSGRDNTHQLWSRPLINKLITIKHNYHDKDSYDLIYRQYTQIHNDLLVDFEILFLKNPIIILLMS
jgi:hypothetical protein